MKRSIGAAGRVAQTLIIRGAGSGASVLLTIVVARFMPSAESAAFLFLLNATVIGAICFRWGMDEVVIRRVASASDLERSIAARHLMGQAHKRVATWAAISATSALIACLVIKGSPFFDDFWAIFLAIAASSFIALAAVGARIQQGAGHTNRAAAVLNIYVPSLTVISFSLIFLVGASLGTDLALLIYALSAAAVYTLSVWFSPSTRPLFDRRKTRFQDRQRREDTRAANRLGGVVVAQQALSWGALLLIPLTYPPEIYTSFVLNFRLTSLISLIMLAINFSFAAKLSKLHTSGDDKNVRRLVRNMMIAAALASTFVAVGLYICRGIFYAAADITPTLDLVMLELSASQIFFALSSVLSLALSMMRDEAWLLLAQGAVTVAGLIMFALLTTTATIEIASTSFIITFAILTLILAARVRSRLRRTHTPNSPRS